MTRDLSARRRALVTVSAPIVFCVLSMTCSSGIRGEEVALTFFGWSDQHIQTDGDASHVTPVIDAMNEFAGTAYPAAIGGRVGKPAFVIGAGDITEWPTHAAVNKYDKLVSKRLKIPAYDVMGNHDDGGLAPSDTMVKWLEKRHGSLSYTFDRGGVHFICLYSEYDHKAGKPAQPISPKALGFVRKDLAKTPKGTPTVVVTHLCFEAITNKDSLVDAFGNANVILVLGGHYHYASVNEYRGFRFVQLPSPKSKWTMFTVVRVTSKRLVAMPYDFVKKEWVKNTTGRRRVLDVRMVGPAKAASTGAARSKQTR